MKESTTHFNLGLGHFILDRIAGWDDKGTATRMPILVAMVLPVMYMLYFKVDNGELTPAMESLVSGAVGYLMIVVVIGMEYLFNLISCRIHRNSISTEHVNDLKWSRLRRLFSVFLFTTIFAGFMSILYLLLSMGFERWFGWEFQQAVFWSYWIVLAGTLISVWMINAFMPALNMGRLYGRLFD